MDPFQNPPPPPPRPPTDEEGNLHLHPLQPAPSITSTIHDPFQDNGASGYQRESYWGNEEDEENVPLTQSAAGAGYGAGAYESVPSSDFGHGGDYGPSPASTFNNAGYGAPNSQQPAFHGYPPSGQAPFTSFGGPQPGFSSGGSLRFAEPNRGGVAFPTPKALRDNDFMRRQTLRHAKTRKVKLSKQGHWIQEYPVPSLVSGAVEEKYKAQGQKNEFTHMRYTAATCDPDDFVREDGWGLRTSQWGRETELLIAVTSYNEDKTLYSRTLHHLMTNIRDICKTRKSKFWRRTAEEGRPGWQRITVALVADGLEPMDKSVLDVLATIGVFQDGVMKKAVDGKPTVAHIFEYTTQVSVNTDCDLIKPHPNKEDNLVPVSIIFVMKQKNAKKINSHRWLFNAVGRHLDPEICVLMDAGTKPGHKAIYHLWEAFYNNKNLGGACGEIHAQINMGKKLINPLVAAQNFEYKMSNILDKPLESSFGYVSVLPGAFSAYRYRAIQGRPLEQYFHGDQTMAVRLGSKGLAGMGIWTQNMYLAEDRILCFELVAKAKERWTLAYVKPSKAETDVPEEAAELISQRRRWLNGSFAASVYSIVRFYRIYKSGHGIIRMFFFHVQALYNIFNLIFSWFALANLWLTFSIVINMISTSDKDGSKASSLFASNPNITYWVNQGVTWLYLGFLFLQFILALGNRPKGERGMYIASFVVFALLSAYLILCSILLSIGAFQGLFKKLVPDPEQLYPDQKMEVDASWEEGFKKMFTDPKSMLLPAAVMSVLGIYTIASFLYRDPWHMFTSFPQYMLMAPSFTNILNVYAFCNLHDVSWGTKGSDKAEALPEVSTKKGKDGAVAEDAIQDEKQLNKAFEETMSRALTPMKIVVEKEPPSMDDSNRTFRTNFVLLWLLCNGALIVAICWGNGLDATKKSLRGCLGEKYNGKKPDGTLRKEPVIDVSPDCLFEAADVMKKMYSDRTDWYFMFLLVGTFALTFVRFIGCLWFWFGRQLGRMCRKN